MEVTKTTVDLGGTCLGAGRTKICIPLMGKTVEEFSELSAKAEAAGADILEIRLDSFSETPDVLEAKRISRAVREASRLPRIMTLRTKRDGGAGTDEIAYYTRLLCDLAKKDVCEAIDVELSCGDAFAEILLHAEIPVIGSYHDFGGTPAMDVIAGKLLEAQDRGAAVAKIAVMPHEKRDVIRLIDAVDSIRDRMHCPVIAISMGMLGMATRVCCGLLGSCLTFATAGEASAPGQIDAKTLGNMLSTLEITDRE